MVDAPWFDPLLRGVTGLALLLVMVVAAWWQFARTRGSSDDPFDSGVD